MATTITIPTKFADRIPAARSYINNVVMRDPNWNGAEFEIEEGDFYSIDAEGLEAQALYSELGRSIGIIES